MFGRKTATPTPQAANNTLSSSKPTTPTPQQLQTSSNANVVFHSNPSSLKIIATPTSELVNTNCVYVPLGIFGCTKEDVDMNPNQPAYVKINGETIFIVRGHSKVEPGCIALNSVQRRVARVSQNLEYPVSIFTPPISNFHLSSITCEIDYARRPNIETPIDGESLIKIIVKVFGNHIFRKDQSFVCDFEGNSLLLTVTEMTVLDTKSLVEKKIEDEDQGSIIQVTDIGMLLATTTILLTRQPKSTIKITNYASKQTTNSIFNPKFNFEQLGIGGLDTEFSSIFRRAFASRIFPHSIVEKLGITHVKGILLYGPPGTGKTLMARQIGKMLNCKDPQVINGPEILNKYVGQSEENIRKLFIAAEKEEKERGPDSELHLIIFDEIDAICRQRGTVGGSTGVHDTVVNQLLSKMDGVNALNNVLIIGMTNRKDLIDDALLRPGRFEVQVEIGLPDEFGRIQILRIHTKNMRDNKFLDDDVNIEELASITKNFSGAELGGLVKSATSFAFNRQVDVNNVSKPIDPSNVKVTMADFRRALQEVKPAFGIATDHFEAYTKDGIINYGPKFNNLLDTCRSFVHQVRSGERTHLLSVLLEGELGAGKTAIAANLAIESGFPYVKIISPETMVGYSEAAKCSQITKIFEDSYKSPLSVILLDNIERLVEYVHIGPRFSNAILQTLLVLLKKVPPKGRKLLILGTTSVAHIIESMEIVDSFNVTLNVPLMEERENIKSILIKCGAFDEEKNKDDLEKSIEVLPEKIAIKKLLMVVEMSQSRAESTLVTYDVFRRSLRDIGL